MLKVGDLISGSKLQRCFFPLFPATPLNFIYYWGKLLPIASPKCNMHCTWIREECKPNSFSAFGLRVSQDDEEKVPHHLWALLLVFLTPPVWSDILTGVDAAKGQKSCLPSAHFHCRIFPVIFLECTHQCKNRAKASLIYQVIQECWQGWYLLSNMTELSITELSMWDFSVAVYFKTQMFFFQHNICGGEEED